jgi:hypothetical protein
LAICAAIPINARNNRTGKSHPSVDLAVDCRFAIKPPRDAKPQTARYPLAY